MLNAACQTAAQEDQEGSASKGGCIGRCKSPSWARIRDVVVGGLETSPFTLLTLATSWFVGEPPFRTGSALRPGMADMGVARAACT